MDFTRRLRHAKKCVGSCEDKVEEEVEDYILHAPPEVRRRYDHYVWYFRRSVEK